MEAPHRGDSGQLRRALSVDTDVQCCFSSVAAAGWSALSFNPAEHDPSIDPYAVLQVAPSATQDELKAAYRRLVKQHHPDAGGDEETILVLNAAWEQLGDPQSRRAFDRTSGSAREEARARGARNARASQAARRASGQGASADQELATWLQKVYVPIDRLLGQVINPLPGNFAPCRPTPMTMR